MKKLFGITEDVHGKKLRTDSKFIMHCNIFNDTLEFAVRNLDDMSLVTENAEQLGRSNFLNFYKKF